MKYLKYLMPLLVIASLAMPAHATTYKVNLICDFDPAFKAGKYKSAHVDFRKKHAPKESCKKNPKFKVILAQFEEEWISTDDAKKRISKDGCRHANTLELLAFGAAHPKMQQGGPILALGAKWTLSTGAPAYPSLAADKDGRHVNLNQDMGSWDQRWLFAIVCNNGK